MKKLGSDDVSCHVSKGRRIVIYHAGTKCGFIQNRILLCGKSFSTASADYHMDMDGNIFRSGFRNKLLPNLIPKCVLILDNASYHSRVEEKIPTHRQQEKVTCLNL